MVNKGEVKTLSGGQFYVKNSLGNLVELKVGDVVNLNDTIVAANSNSDLSKLGILLGNNQLITFSQGELLLDSSIFENTFGNEEVAFASKDVDSSNKVLDAWKKAENNISDMETAAGDEIQQETQAGEEPTKDGGALKSKFSAREGVVTDIQSIFNEIAQIETQIVSKGFVEDEIPAHLRNLHDDISVTIEDTEIEYSEETPKITLQNAVVYENEEFVTITANVNPTSKETLKITLQDTNGNEIGAISILGG